jgi:glycerol-3-phosphate dehydrogenase
MTRDLSALTGRTFDLLVIGGGITGACLAHDAALRGLSVALVEKGDFGGATSAASSKLLHGGIRYLQQAQAGKVRESAVERLAFLRIAPHLVRWVPFLLPTTRAPGKGRWLLGAGILAYRAIVAGHARALADPARQPPGESFLSRQEVLARYPLLGTLPGLTGAWVIHEAHMHSSERMTLAFVKTAARHGAAVANRVEVTGFLREGARVAGVVAIDRESGRRLEMAARVVANAAGPWIGALNGLVGAAHLERDIRGFSKGVHLVTPPLLGDAAVGVPSRHRAQAVIQRGGRHLFVIPWRGHSLIGTTNVPFEGTPDEVAVTRADVDGFLDDINRALPGAGLTAADVRYAFAGLYPLTEEEIRPDVYQGTGFYQIVDHAARGEAEGFVSVLGAKYTTARRLAERAVDLVFRKLGRRPVPCTTHSTPLVGGDIDDLAAFRRAVADRHGQRASAVVLDHLVAHYGREVEVLLADTAPGALDLLSPDLPIVEAEIRHAAAREMALHLDDIVFRRTGLGTVGHPGAAALARAAALAGAVLGWDAARQRAEIDRVERHYAWGA